MSEQVLVRADPKQKKRWEQGAKRAGVKLAEYARQAIDQRADSGE